MATKSNIQWTDATWNIARGCTKVDEDCKYCYMYRDSLKGTRYEPKQVTRTKTVFNLPLRLKEPSKIFTSSLTDFFHEDIDGFRHEAWDIIRRCPQHTFQILTKRPERIVAHLPDGWGTGWHNVWIGTSSGHNDSEKRVRDLISARFIGGIKTIFLSLEPMHGRVTYLKDFYFIGRGFDHLHPTSRTTIAEMLDWVIVGGESGNENGMYRYRSCDLEWIENVVKQCRSAHTSVFVKQLGTHLAKQLKLSDRHGGNIEEWPEHLRIREFPKGKVEEVNNG
jgi:protein gp37